MLPVASSSHSARWGIVPGVIFLEEFFGVFTDFANGTTKNQGNHNSAYKQIRAPVFDLNGGKPRIQFPLYWISETGIHNWSDVDPCWR